MKIPDIQSTLLQALQLTSWALNPLKILKNRTLTKSWKIGAQCVLIGYTGNLPYVRQCIGIVLKMQTLCI